jgi:peroxiredoxin Q/BCP
MAQKTLQSGQKAPELELVDSQGQTVRIADLWQAKVLVLYFYPKDETPGCTAEACAFRDQYQVFQEAGAEVVGVSSDSPDSHSRFASHHSLPFILLSDPEQKARQAFGVNATLGFMPGRVTFVIDTAGVIRYQFSSQMRAAAHVSKALEVVRSLS